MTRPAWWVAIGVAAVAIAAFGHPSSPTFSAAGPPGIDLQRLQHTTTQVTLRSLSIDGLGSSTSAVVGNGGSVVLQAGYAIRSTAETPTVVVHLQRRIGSGGWTSTGVDAAPTSGGPLMVRTPTYSATSAATTVQYRLASDSSTSSPISVVYENQQRYTGMAATIYRYAAPYCPHTAVHIADLTGREAGEYQTGALLILIDRKVGSTVNTGAISQRAVALHECSHELQWLNYGGTSSGREQMEADAALHFTEGSNGAAPLEHAADCGAKSANPAGYLGYGGYCTTAELEVASRLLAGQQY